MAYQIDDHDLLSAIWVMACNDENPIITFQGLRYRLNLQERLKSSNWGLSILTA